MSPFSLSPVRHLLILALFALASCSSAPSAPQRERPPSSVYVPQGAPKLTLLTVVNNRTGGGGHTALLVSGREQVIFDPAGSFRHPEVYEQGDVLYGMSPAWVQAFKSAHARSTYHVVSQEIEVSPAQADRALQLVKANGRVNGAFCTNATARLLRQVPGFEAITVTFYPTNLMEQVARRGDVRTDRYYEDDEGDVVAGIVPVEG